MPTHSLSPTGLIAALLAAISPIAVYYSQEARMYPLLPTIGLISLILTTRLLAAGRQRDWILWVVINAAGLYVYYYLGLLTAAEALVLLGFALQRHQLRRWILAQVVTLALYLPWASEMLRLRSGSALALPPATTVHLTPASFLAEIWQDFTVGFTAPPHAQLLLAAFGIAALAGAIALGRRNPALLALLLLSIIIPLAGAGAVLLVRPFFYPRFVLFALVPLWALAAIGLASYRRLWPIATIFVLLILAGNGWTWYQERTTPRTGYAPDDYRTVFPTLAAHLRTGDVVLTSYPWQAGYVQAYLWREDPRTAFITGPVDSTTLARLIGPSGRAWLYSYSPDHRFEGNKLEQALAAREPTLVVDQYGDTRVRLFAPSGSPAPAASPLSATFGNEIGLISSQVQVPEPARPGSSLRITLRWRALTKPKASYKIFVHLLDPSGKVAAQHDGPPLGGAFPTDQWRAGEVLVDRYTLTIPDNAAPGQYQIELGIYRPTDGKRLTVGPMPEKDNRVIIGALTVGD